MDVVAFVVVVRGVQVRALALLLGIAHSDEFARLSAVHSFCAMQVSAFACEGTANAAIPAAATVAPARHANFRRERPELRSAFNIRAPSLWVVDASRPQLATVRLELTYVKRQRRWRVQAIDQPLQVWLSGAGPERSLLGQRLLSSKPDRTAVRMARACLR